MWHRPFEKQLCFLFLSAALITLFISLKERLKNQLEEEVEEQDDDFLVDYYPNDTGTDGKLIVDFINASLPDVRHFQSNDDVEDDDDGNRTEIVYILGLFELTNPWGKRAQGISEMRAAQLAVSHVNKFKLLPGYNLILLINDTRCDPGIGIDRFFHALYSNRTILMLLSSACSNVTERLAHVVPYWNILQVSFGSTSPALSDRNKFPLFFRTVAPDSSHNNAKIHFVKQFGWGVVATLSQSENAYLLPLHKLVKQLEKVNISCISTITFSMENYKEQLRVLKDLDIRIVIASFSSLMAPKIFCTVYELNMFGPDYVWILQDHDESWWHSLSDCPKTDLIRSIEGIILVADYNRLSTSLSGLNGLDLVDELNVSEADMSRYAKQAYDAIWAMGLSLRASVMSHWLDPLQDFRYTRKDMVCRFMQSMSALSFIGVSGPVKFDGADRIGNSILRQIQGGQIKDIAIFDSLKNELDFNCKQCNDIFWENKQVPIAQRILKVSLITIPGSLFYLVVSISIMGIGASFLFLYFNLHFRRMKTVKLSSPKLNNVAVFGCILVYASVIILGLHNVHFESGYYSQFCMVRVYMLSSGFSLAFGSMFAKTYRVHRLTYSGANLVKDKLLKDKQLIALILIPLIIDGIIVTLWVMIDPMERHLHNLTLQLSGNEPGVVYQPQVEFCRSQNTIGWYIALYSYKGLILIMGVFMAWKTRHIKVAALNDSQYIGICVYSAVFSAIIVVLCSFISNYLVFSYLAKTASIITSTTITLFLLFLPKLKSVFGKVDVEDSLMQSMGLKIECNTRRFISHDPKELIYRLEIQNKVYKCELDALDKEIGRLEGMLRHSSKSSTCSTRSSINGVESAIVDCHYLKVPTPVISRASWPNARGLLIARNDFMSENKLNNDFFERFNIFGKLKRIFGSIPSVSRQSNIVVNMQNVGGNDLFQINSEKRKLTSNPEFYSQLRLPFNKNMKKAKSDSDQIHKLYG